MVVEVAVFRGHQGFQQVRRHLVDLDQDAVFEVLRINAADHQRLQANHVELAAIGPGKPRHIVAREANANELRHLHALVELEATGVEIDGVAVDRRRARAVGRAFTAIAQGIEFGEEVVLAQFLADEQLQRPGIDLGRNGPALAGELLLDDGIEVDREAGNDHQADQAELQGPAQPGARAASRAFLRGTRVSSSSHGGGLYALCNGWAGALWRYAGTAPLTIMAHSNSLPPEGFPVSQALITALQNPALYPHPVDGFQLIETHISWVLLTGEYAYKIKKPMNFGFLDFTGLDQRQHFCNEELRLNQRLTEGLYLEVLPITGSVDAPQIGGEGEAIEYVLKMRQFPQGQMLNTLQANGELNAAHIDQMARQIAEFHLQAPRVPVEHPLGTPDSVMAPVEQNFEQIRPFLSDKADLQQLDALQAWARSSFERLHGLLEKRKANGFIRECHGDIHLGNATLIDGKVVIFDCIEFNEPFRLTDVYADTGFLAMDLEDRGLKCLARRFISQYLELTGDYEGLELLNFYKAYRALVRAKVALFSMPADADGVQRATTLRTYRNYANLAESYSAIPSRLLAITHGVSAVGKSHVAMRMVEALGAVRVRSDVERKRLFGEQQQADAGQLSTGIYDQDASVATYQRLHEVAATVLRAGFPVVLDATYLKRDQRQAAADIASQTGVPFLILDCHAPDAVIASWLEQRRAENTDPSDATLEVVKAQQASREPLSAQELVQSTRVDTQSAGSMDQVIEQIRQRLPGL
ncbi:hypothetical protein D3C76_489500 [compost metagenome]